MTIALFSQFRKYGKGQEWDGTIDRVDTSTGLMHFTVLHNGKPFGSFASPMVGEHNLYNMVAISAALDFNGITAEQLLGWEEMGFTSLPLFSAKPHRVGKRVATREAADILL